MIQLFQCDLVDMLITKVKAAGSWRSGTYNRADPTHYEKGKADFYVGDEPIGICPESGGQEYAHVILRVEFYDCTWGVDFKFIYSVGEEGRKDEVSKAYFDRDGKWLRIDGEFFRDFRNALLSEPWKEFVEREQHDEQMDPAGGYGLESHR